MTGRRPVAIDGDSELSARIRQRARQDRPRVRQRRHLAITVPGGGCFSPDLRGSVHVAWAASPHRHGRTSHLLLEVVRILGPHRLDGSGQPESMPGVEPLRSRVLHGDPEPDHRIARPPSPKAG